ncbi:MAG: response regulator [Anaerolineae bacterium]|nr:response regulator [Anaerolineae bacterium]
MRPLKIFIVDDSQDFAESLADILKLEGHQVELAFDGETAIEKFREKNFDITFMDVRLPGMNGVDSFFEIRKINPRAKVVMMTGYSVERLLSQAIEHGALGVLRKPLEISELLELLEELRPGGIILLADDDQDFVDSLEDFLTDYGYLVAVAHTGPEAVDGVLANNIDILILDLKLPLLSGLEVYLTLKKHNRVVPTIIVTAYAVEEADNIDKLRTMSVSDCFIKPFDPEDLLEAIRIIMKGKTKHSTSISD